MTSYERTKHLKKQIISPCDRLGLELKVVQRLSGSMELELGGKN